MNAKVNICPSTDCNNSIEKGDDYCSGCGAPVDAESERIRTIAAEVSEQGLNELASKLKETKHVELSLTQTIESAVLNRVKFWSTLTAVPLLILTATLGYWGVSSFSELKDKIKSATGRVELTNEAINEIDAHIDPLLAIVEKKGSSECSATIRSSH